MKITVRLAAAAAALAVAAGWWVTPAHADELTDERDALQQRMAQAREEIGHSTAAVTEAVARLDQSQAELQTAKAALATAQAELDDARAKDAEAAGSLASAVLRAQVAGAAVQQGQEAIAQQRSVVGANARESYQQNTTLIGVSTLFNAQTTAQLNTRLQWTVTIADTTQAELTRLEDLQAELSQSRNQQQVLEAQADTVRSQAAVRLTATTKAEEKARQASEAVAAAVRANEAAKAAAEQALENDRAELEALQREADDVNRRIAERAAAARRAAEEAQRRAAAAGSGSGSAAAPASGSKGLVYPVNGPVTSPYGMRLHPVLRIWKLHDGVDFGAGCGTPIKAAAAGVVTEAYFNAGYGNRLFVDHGSVNGKAMTTSYNHLQGYAVKVGQRVAQGQTIGYVGNTGYSTGCHLHYMLWVNGSLVNPMTYY